jgi:hypothetical protein
LDLFKHLVTGEGTLMPVFIHLGSKALNLFKDLPAERAPFLYLSKVWTGDRATEFKSRCHRLGINGVTLHRYRYAWAECSLISKHVKNELWFLFGSNPSQIEQFLGV